MSLKRRCWLGMGVHASNFSALEAEVGFKASLDYIVRTCLKNQKVHALDRV